MILKMNEIINGKDNDGSNDAFSNSYKLAESSLYGLKPLCLFSLVNNDTKRDVTKELEFRIQNMTSDIQEEKQKLIETKTM